MSRPGNSLRNYIQIGDTLAGRYFIEDTVGSGAFGAIYSAIDQQTGERVAVKALPPQDAAASDTALARFQREMKVISNLIHRNIIGLYDFGQTSQDVFFMILEYVDGETLDRVAHRAPLEHDEVIEVCEQIVSALELAHHRGVIHRDLKPANIMLTRSRTGYGVKVLDFGMAKLLSRIDDESIPQLTREGMAVGTPRYIAPEQARGDQVGPWTDLYAVGLLMYEMLTGARAVKADDVEGAVSAHVSPEPLKLQELDQVPEAFRPVLFRLIEKNPQQRYRATSEVLADLDALRYNTGVGLGSSKRPTFDPLKARVEGGAEFEASLKQDEASRVPQERRKHAQRVAAEARREQDIDVDWEAFDRHAPRERDPARPKREKEGVHVFFRPPDSPFEWAEACVAPMLGLFAFVLLTVHLRSFDYTMRVATGLVPVAVAFVWSVGAGRGSWRYSFFRLWNLFSAAAALVAHALGPSKLITELYRHPSWFLAPVRELPGMDGVEGMLSWVMRRYAVVLSTLLDAGGNLIN